MESKTCTLCKQTKPIEDFFNNSKYKDKKVIDVKYVI